MNEFENALGVNGIPIDSRRFAMREDLVILERLLQLDHSRGKGLSAVCM